MFLIRFMFNVSSFVFVTLLLQINMLFHLKERNCFLKIFAGVKDADKSRLHSGRSSSEDVRSKSPLSDSRSSLYSFSAGKTSERPSSVLDRYNRPASREKSRESDGVSRYGSSTYPGSSFGRTYGNDGRIEKKDHPPVSYRGLRSNSGRTSREPSPEVSVGKTNSFRVYSRASSYSRSAASPSKYITFSLFSFCCI